MKKLITLLLLFTITLFYSIPTQAALTPPALFDYSYTYNGTTFVFSDGTNTYIPEFTETANPLGGDDYEYIGDMDGVAPFEITLKFIRSTTSWTFNTTGYIPTSAFVGADLTYGANSERWYINVNNDTANHYHIWIDESDSTASANAYITILYENNISATYQPFAATQNIRILTTSFLNVYSPIGINTTIFNTSGTINRYMSAFYLTNLGVSPTVSNDTLYQTGFIAGFGDGYQQAVLEDNAYALGYAKGLLEGSDMETGSSLLILIVALIGFILMIIGFITKRGIFNLLSTGAFIVLGGLLVEFVGFIIIAIGLVLINIYYAFFGNV